MTAAIYEDAALILQIAASNPDWAHDYNAPTLFAIGMEIEVRTHSAIGLAQDAYEEVSRRRRRAPTIVRKQIKLVHRMAEAECLVRDGWVP